MDPAHSRESGNPGLEGAAIIRISYDALPPGFMCGRPPWNSLIATSGVGLCSRSDRVFPLEIVLLVQIKQILLELKVAVAERFDERFEHVG